MTNAIEGKRVAVVGAAMGGAGAALVLARAGARVTLLERVAEPAAVGAGILLQPNGLGVLYGLGLKDRLHAKGVVARRIRAADEAGRAILDRPVPDFGDGIDHVLLIRRSELFAALHDAVAADAAIERRFGTELLSATRDGRVILGDGEALAFDLVVGADGVHSRVRGSGAFDATSKLGLWYVRALTPGRFAIDVLTEYWTSAGIFGAAPLPDGTYWYASVKTPALRDAFERRDFAGFGDVWARTLPLAGEILAATRSFDDVLLNQVEEIACRSFVDGRLVLLGDAAHAMAPNLGQGANSALVDAAVLGHELTRASDLEAALAAWDARRRPAVRSVQTTAWRMGAASEATNAIVRALRDNVARFAVRFAGDGPVRAAQQEDPAWLLRTVRKISRGDPS